MLHKCFVSWGLVRHIARPIFFRDLKNIKMIILMRPARYAFVHADLSLVGGETHDGSSRGVATAAAIVMVVVVFVRAFNVVVVVVLLLLALHWFLGFVRQSAYECLESGPCTWQGFLEEPLRGVLRSPPRFLSSILH